MVRIINRPGFLRVAAVSPDFNLGDPRSASNSIIELAVNFNRRGAKLIVFPELCLTGYTMADMFDHEFIQNAALDALKAVCDGTAAIDSVLIVGMPLRIGAALYDVAVVIERGIIKGVVPKTFIPTSNEFYEGRWFAGADCLAQKEIFVLGREVPVGTDLLFESDLDRSVVIGVEICEDLWVPIPPSSNLAMAGATVIVNVSASNELVDKAAYRTDLVKNQSARCIAAYIYASAGPSESTTDVVFGGHCIIAENSRLQAQNERFSMQSEGIIADIDTQSLLLERIRTTSFAQNARQALKNSYRTIRVGVETALPRVLMRQNPAYPFVPEESYNRAKACEEVFSIQTAALARRLRSLERQAKKQPHVIIGLSGGLDSTLAYLVAVKAFERLGYDSANIHIYSLPYALCTSNETKSNARNLADAMGIGLEEIAIDGLVDQTLISTGHAGGIQDVAFENAQARARTLFLMQKSNMYAPSIVIGTGDMSELALGWCTFNGDHMSHYNVNAGVPKTLVRHVVEWVSGSTKNEKLTAALAKILATPISPELTSSKEGRIAQFTEDIIGPYPLHDFFLYHMIRRGSHPKKVAYLASLAFPESMEDILKWMRVFITRFLDAQFKRATMPEGPRIGLVDLSPRGGLRLPSDLSPDAWLRELDQMS